MNATHKLTGEERISKSVPNFKHRGGFTLIELLVVIVILAILAAILLPVLAKAKKKAIGVACINNEKQLMLAFRMYADDNNDVMISCPDVGAAFDPQGRPNFVNGDLTAPTGFDPTVQANWNPNVNIKPSPLYPYLSKPDLFHCPGDPVLLTVTTVPAGSGLKPGQYPRIRSISLNVAFGIGDWIPASSMKLYSKYGSIDRPANTFTFIDQHPNDINDANFAIQADPSPEVVDRVGPFHSAGHGSGLSYADGHAEIHAWLGNNIDPPWIPNNTTHYLGYGFHPSSDPSDMADAAWLATRASVHQ
jgi:prepilin-type N-terminal cleavage/methylation domain-containing protein